MKLFFKQRNVTLLIFSCKGREQIMSTNSPMCLFHYDQYLVNRDVSQSQRFGWPDEVWTNSLPKDEKPFFVNDLKTSVDVCMIIKCIDSILKPFHSSNIVRPLFSLSIQSINWLVAITSWVISNLFISFINYCRPTWNRNGDNSKYSSRFNG
jgi:hypothetical protein